MKNTLIQPYLFFGGRCEEALAFYGTALGAKVDFLVRYKESPEPMPPGRLRFGAFLVAHEEVHLRAERGAVKLERLFAAAAEEQVGLDDGMTHR